MAYLLGRAARGTLTPGNSAFEFASPSTPRDHLGRWKMGTAGSLGAVTGQENCGASDEYGHCIERFHAAGCGSIADPFTADAVRPQMRDMAARPLADASGRRWA